MYMPIFRFAYACHVWMDVDSPRLRPYPSVLACARASARALSDGLHYEDWLHDLDFRPALHSLRGTLQRLGLHHPWLSAQVESYLGPVNDFNMGRPRHVTKR